MEDWACANAGATRQATRQRDQFTQLLAHCDDFFPRLHSNLADHAQHVEFLGQLLGRKLKALAGQHEHRNVLGFFMFTHPFDQLQAIEARHLAVGDDQVGSQIVARLD